MAKHLYTSKLAISHGKLTQAATGAVGALVSDPPWSTSRCMTTPCVPCALTQRRTSSDPPDIEAGTGALYRDRSRCPPPDLPIRPDDKQCRRVSDGKVVEKSRPRLGGVEQRRHHEPPPEMSSQVTGIHSYCVRDRARCQRTRRTYLTMSYSGTSSLSKKKSAFGVAL